MKLIIEADLIETPFTTTQDHWIGVVDLSEVSEQEKEDYYFEVGMYPWYGTCGKILKIKEIEV